MLFAVLPLYDSFAESRGPPSSGFYGQLSRWCPAVQQQNKCIDKAVDNVWVWVLV